MEWSDVGANTGGHGNDGICSLHSILENRMGLRMLMFCLKEGLTNAKGDEHGVMLDWMTTISSIQERKISSSNHKSMHEYLILGMEANPTQRMVHTIPKRNGFNNMHG